MSEWTSTDWIVFGICFWLLFMAGCLAFAKRTLRPDAIREEDVSESAFGDASAYRVHR